MGGCQMTVSTERRRERVVLAGAGTGKTNLLAEHYLALVRDHSPLSLVAVTFTERAAAELRARIRARAKAANLPDELIAQLDAAPIGTVHALAARICRDHPAQAGVPGEFVVLDARQTQQWTELHLPLALQALQPEVLRQLPYSRLLSILRVLLGDPYTYVAQLTASAPPTAEHWQASIAEAKQRAWNQLRALPAWQAAQETVKRMGGAAGDRLEDCRAQVCGVLENPDALVSEAVDLIDNVKLTWGSKKAWSGADLSVTREALGALRTLVRGEPILFLTWNTQDGALMAALPALVQTLHQVHDQLYAWRAVQGQLSFADLEGRALAALQHSPVQAHYHNRFKAILVDECQDISPAQLTLLRALGQEAETTYVGDPLQAIYGFRTGHVPLANLTSREGNAPGSEDQRLSHSYRAQQGLLDPLNTALNHLTRGQHRPLTAARAPMPSATPLTFLEITTEGSRSAQLQAEAGAVAREIAGILDAGQQVCDTADGLLRAVRPGDIALLSRTWKPLDHFQQALLDLNIPAFQAGGGDLLSTPEARDAWALLRAAGDPADDLATAALLRSPLLQFQDAHLSALWETRLDKEPWQAAILRSRQPEHARARQFFQELRSRQAGPPVDILLIADRFGYRSGLQLYPDAARRTADWDAVLQLTVTLEPECPTPRAAALRIRRMHESQLRLPRPPLMIADAVTLSSIHQAKGLEWPIVFVVDLGGKPAPETSPAYVLEEGLVFGGNPFTRTKPALLDYARIQKKRADAEELGHVLYVAATRARDRLYASGPAGSTAPAFLQMSASFDAACARREHHPVSLQEDQDDPDLHH